MKRVAGYLVENKFDYRTPGLFASRTAAEGWIGRQAYPREWQIVVTRWADETDIPVAP